MKKRDESSAVSISPHRLGAAERSVSSRNTRNRRRPNQLRLKLSRIFCSNGALSLSASWLYEMNAS